MLYRLCVRQYLIVPHKVSHDISVRGFGRDDGGEESGRKLQENANYEKWDEMEKGENAKGIVKILPCSKITGCKKTSRTSW